MADQDSILHVASAHRLLMWTAGVRILVWIGVQSLLSTDVVGPWAAAPWVLSLVLGVFMAYFGFECCRVVYGALLASLAAMFLFAPFTWLLAMLLINGSIADYLYKHVGSVGFFGATADQLVRLKKND